MTGYRGVYKRGNRFEAYIRIGGKPQYLGLLARQTVTANLAKEAAVAYDLAAILAKRPKAELT